MSEDMKECDMGSDDDKVKTFTLGDGETPQPREWTLYVRNGKLLPGPSMDAEAVPVTETSAYDALKRECEEWKARADARLDAALIAHEIKVLANYDKGWSALQDECDTLRSLLVRMREALAFYAASPPEVGVSERTVAGGPLAPLGEAAREALADHDRVMKELGLGEE